MITLTRATTESRPRDLKRRRWILRIESYSNTRIVIHLTPAEVRDLVRQARAGGIK
jgi:hypothetical protein